MNKKKKILFFLVGFWGIICISACSKQPDFDAKSYVQSSLDAYYHGDYKDYANLLEISEKDAKKEIEELEELQTISCQITPALIYLIGLGPTIGNRFGRNMPWICEYMKTNSLAKKQMCDYFTHPYWEQIETIIGRTFDDVLAYRTKRPTLFLDIACGGRLFRNEAFKTTIGTLGCLSVKTSADLVYNFLPRSCEGLKVDADWFLCLHQFYNLMFTSDAVRTDPHGNKYIEKECELKQWCHNCFTKKGEPDLTMTSYNCKRSPWLNTSPDKMAQCSFGRL